MGSLLLTLLALNLGLYASTLAVFLAWSEKRSAQNIISSLTSLQVELSKKLDQLHKKSEEYYE
jgi:hypothetical protein